MDVTAIVLSYKRVPNIDKVVSSLLNNTVKPKSTIIINNNPEVQLEGYPATIINCSRNFGCSIRHALGLLADTSHCLFQDDDLWLEPEAINNFIGWSKKFPEAILGYFGKQIKNNSYSMGAEVHTKHIKTATKVVVVKGRVHFCRTDKLIQPFSLLSKLSDYPSGEDDISHRLCSLDGRVSLQDLYDFVYVHVRRKL